MKNYLLSIVALAAFSAQASNYPPNYSWQTARSLTRGAVVFAYVGSGIGSNYIWGYKNSGTLAQTNPDHIDAVVTTTCTGNDGSQSTKQTTVRLGREWHGTGYMSAPMGSLFGFYPNSCPYNVRGELQIAFSDGNGNWDSEFGANYRLSEQSMYSNDAVTYATGESGPYNSSSINDKAWAFIIDQMRK